MADLLAAPSLTSESIAPLSDKLLEQLGLSEKDVKLLMEQSVGWASAHGLMIMSGTSTCTHVPFSLLPIKFPKREFEKGKSLSQLFCSLVHKVSLDLDWLHGSLESVLKTDKFTAKLLELSKEVHAEGLSQTAQLGIFRSDYMLHEPADDTDQLRIQQVELNTIASSFGCFSSYLCTLHLYLFDRYGPQYPKLLQHYGIKDTTDLTDLLPPNPALDEICRALADAHMYYGNKDAVIVFVVQTNERNSFDQRLLEYALWDKYRIPVIRRSLDQIFDAGKLIDPDRRLVIDGKEVAVAYFRAGYTPNDYPQEKMWEGRKLLERSHAIKCPSIAYHLAGTKKVQQMLANPQHLRRFASEEECALLEQSFTGLYGLEKSSDTTQRTLEMALANPATFVMKPQREGGGNNLYGDDIVTAIKSMSPEEIESYILMSRIFPPKEPAILVRNCQADLGQSISELGMFGVCLFNKEEEIFNRHAGHLLRTKLENTNEGGVATGYAVLSSPFLV